MTIVAKPSTNIMVCHLIPKNYKSQIQMKKIFSIFIGIFGMLTLHAQKKQTTAPANVQSTSPQLVIGLVVDQMRWDYLEKFKPYFTTGGFNRLAGEGYNCDNTLITHMPTYTAVGHAGIYTGSYPSIHGIVGNNWTDKITGKPVYCTDDATVSGVGSDNDAGKMSPRNMLANTVGDQLHLSNQYQSKVIGISIKDRSAIFPAGHSANAAYWFDENTGKFITSSYYMNQLPSWVDAFNGLKLADQLMKQDWSVSSKLLNNSSIATQDNEPYEKDFPGLNGHVFPYHLDSIKSGKYKSFKYTPFGNTFTFEFAKKAISQEQLGHHTVTDFLTLSMSSPDYVGHTFGPNSLELLDTYVSLDAELANFLQYLDSTVGKGKYLLFLTADHGVANNPEFLKAHHEQGGNYDTAGLMAELNDSLNRQFGVSKKVIAIDNSQLYLRPLSDSAALGKEDKIRTYLVELLQRKTYILHAFQLTNQPNNVLPERLRTAVSNSYYFKRSGDIMIIPNAGWQDGNGKGSTHGVWNPYDAHIPLIWFGWKIRSGHDNHEYHMSDIAPTLSALLHIQMPNGAMGQVINEIVK